MLAGFKDIKNDSGSKMHSKFQLTAFNINSN